MMTFTKSLYSVAALIVYISVLEQQAKYGDALEILSGKLGSLIMIEVDRLRMQVLSTQTLCCIFALDFGTTISNIRTKWRSLLVKYCECDIIKMLHRFVGPMILAS